MTSQPHATTPPDELDEIDKALRLIKFHIDTGDNKPVHWKLSMVTGMEAAKAAITAYADRLAEERAKRSYQAGYEQGAGSHTCGEPDSSIPPEKESLNRTVTLEELKANKKVGWYANKGGVVYQVITISPRKVRYIGKLDNAHPESDGR